MMEKSINIETSLCAQIKKKEADYLHIEINWKCAVLKILSVVWQSPNLSMSEFNTDC